MNEKNYKFNSPNKQNAFKFVINIIALISSLLIIGLLVKSVGNSFVTGKPTDFNIMIIAKFEFENLLSALTTSYNHTIRQIYYPSGLKKLELNNLNYNNHFKTLVTNQINSQKIDASYPRKVPALGIVNCGRTCYINTLFQLMLSIPIINATIMTLKIYTNENEVSINDINSLTNCESLENRQKAQLINDINSLTNCELLENRQKAQLILVKYIQEAFIEIHEITNKEGDQNTKFEAISKDDKGLSIKPTLSKLNSLNQWEGLEGHPLFDSCNLLDVDMDTSEFMNIIFESINTCNVFYSNKSIIKKFNEMIAPEVAHSEYIIKEFNEMIVPEVVHSEYIIKKFNEMIAPEVAHSEYIIIKSDSGQKVIIPNNGPANFSSTQYSITLTIKPTDDDIYDSLNNTFSYDVQQLEHGNLKIIINSLAKLPKVLFLGSQAIFELKKNYNCYNVLYLNGYLGTDNTTKYYQLHAVVLYSGTGQKGHYLTIINDRLQTINYTKYDDVYVTEYTFDNVLEILKFKGTPSSLVPVLLVYVQNS